MPVDKNGKELKIGDRVTVSGIVTHVSPQEDGTNVRVRPDGESERGRGSHDLHVNGRQVEVEGGTQAQTPAPLSAAPEASVQGMARAAESSAQQKPEEPSTPAAQ